MENNMKKALLQFLKNHDKELVTDFTNNDDYEADFLVRDDDGDYHFVYVTLYSQEDFVNETIVDRKVFEQDMTHFMFNGGAEYEQGAMMADNLDIAIITDGRALLRYHAGVKWDE